MPKLVVIESMASKYTRFQANKSPHAVIDFIADNADNDENDDNCPKGKGTLLSNRMERRLHSLPPLKTRVRFIPTGKRAQRIGIDRRVCRR